MEETRPPRLICLGRAIRNPWVATAMACLGSDAIYILLYYLLHLPLPLHTGIFISTLIPLIIGYPIFMLISEQNRHIRSQNRRLHELNEQKNVLFSLIAHDMRSPLAQLKQSLDFAAEDSDYAREAVEEFPAITRRVDKTLGLLDNLLTWSRGSLQQDSDDAREVAIQPLIDDLTEQLREPLQEKHLTVQNGITGCVTLSTRVDILKLVLRNLITNAIKYTPEHGYIDVSCHQGKHQLCLTIKDNGIGMDEQTLGKLFGRERITVQPGTRGETGSGIGLLLSKQLLHSIGGTIRAESQPGQGSHFYVTLPLHG
jgi:signal transduction histidine kinase